MPEQLSFAEFDRPSRPPTDRLFYAVFPDVAAAACVAHRASHQREKHGLKGKPLETDRFHVTLHHLGDYVGDPPQGTIAAALDAGAAVAALPFDVEFDCAMSFGQRRNAPLVLCGGDGVAALTAFQHALGVAMMRAGLGRLVERRFTPHVTLLYHDRHVEKQAVEPVGWTVREFVLVRSLLGQTRHIPLGRWSLLG